MRSGRGQRSSSLQHRHPGRLVELEVVVAHAGHGEQLGDDLLVDRRVLAHVEPAQVVAERDDGPPHRLDERRRRARPRRGTRSDAWTTPRSSARSSTRSVRPAGRTAGGGTVRSPAGRAEHVGGQRVQPGVHPPQRPPVGLVGAERRVVARRVGQRRPARRSASRGATTSTARSTAAGRRRGGGRTRPSAWRLVAVRSTSAVTNGLPSRSPPIHEPMRTTSVASTVTPQRSPTRCSRSRSSAGTTSNRLVA